jgi:hypothetical protein
LSLRKEGIMRACLCSAVAALAAVLAQAKEPAQDASRERLMPALLLRSYFCDSGLCFGHIRCAGVTTASEDGSVAAYTDLEVTFDDDSPEKVVLTDHTHRVLYVDLYGNGTVNLVRDLDDLSRYRIVSGPSADVDWETRARIQAQYRIDEMVAERCLRKHLGPPPL